MVKLDKKIRFKEKDVALFSQISHDRNPLHMDPEYARKTPYGQRVVFGVLGALSCIKASGLSDRFVLSEISIEFRHPLFMGEEYDLWTDEKESEFTFKLKKGEKTLLSFHALFQKRIQKGLKKDIRLVCEGKSNIPNLRKKAKILVEDEVQQKTVVEGRYCINRLDDSETNPFWMKQDSQFCSVLMLTSYIIGMEIPGKNALFTKLKLNLEKEPIGQEANRESELVFSAVNEGYEEMYRLHKIKLNIRQNGQRLATGELHAFNRKELKTISYDNIKQQSIAIQDKLEGKVALVVGGSRGLGAVIAMMLAKNGCHVLLNYFGSKTEAKYVQKQINDGKGKCTLIQGDAADADLWKKFSQKHKNLDFLICNACASPMLLDVSTASQEQIQSYVSNNLALFKEPTSGMIDLLSQSKGALIAISSIFVETRPKEFSHYIETKQSMEESVQAFAKANPDISFLIARPPRLLTAMNNTPLGIMESILPEKAAKLIVEKLALDLQPGKVEILNRFELPGGATTEEEEEEKNSADKVVISGSFTLEPICQPFQQLSSELGWDVVLEFAPYSQIFQELLNPASQLLSNRSGLNVVFLRFEDWLKNLRIKKEKQTCSNYLNDLLQDFTNGLKFYGTHSSCHLLILLCPSSIKDHDVGLKPLFNGLKKQLAEQVKVLEGIDLISVEERHITYNISDIYDPFRDEIGHIPFTDLYYQFLATQVARFYYGINSKVYKVIVLDCDNTLWGGVCGEVGGKNVVVDHQFRRFHEFLVKQAGQGVLLCLCSKNVEDDVWEVFQQQKNMLLTTELITDYRINWFPKSENIRSMAASLNLGLDSFIFIDDNPVECMEVQSNCPEVLTIQFPETVEEVDQLINHMWVFDRYDVTNEDQNRTRMYKAQVARGNLQKQSSGFSDFIKKLDLQIDFKELSDSQINRVSQLTNRTNQFNFTTIRRTQKEIQHLSLQQNSACLTVTVKDRFGEYGLVGVIIYTLKEKTLLLDTFLLSCRVLGRGVEHKMVAKLGAIAAEAKMETVRVKIYKTPKNEPAARFLKSISQDKVIEEDEEKIQVVFSPVEMKNICFKPERSEMHDAPAKKGIHAVSADNQVVGDDVRKLEKLMLKMATITADMQMLTAWMADHQAGEEPASTIKNSSVLNLQTEQEYDRVKNTVLTQVKQIFSKQLSIPEENLDENERLEVYIQDSFHIVEITVELKKVFNSVHPTFLFEHASLNSIVEALIGDRPRDDEKSSIGAPVSLSDKNRRIAIIGINGIYPGSADLNQLWDHLSSGNCLIKEIPQDRWDADWYYSQDKTNETTTCKWGGFLDNIDRFDNAFFNISPIEAKLMDPQQRLMLETTWGLLEDAGYTSQKISRQTGVFVGAISSDYRTFTDDVALHGQGAYRCSDYYQISNRISYFFDLRGPSLTVDTACSSSGTALHLACKSLENEECETAIVGGINLILHPSRFIQYTQMGLLSNESKCRPFSEKANGTLLGEGVGAVLLKPLSSAERDQDHIYGVIRSSAVNAGGKTNGFTVPNPQAHSELIVEALQNAGVSPESISYVEAHGTGTILGDPIEVHGLTSAFQKVSSEQKQNPVNTGPQKPYCALGSIKSNMGHLESGAMILGLIKILLQFKHGLLVPSLFSEPANPHISFEKTPFYVQRATQEWKRPVHVNGGGKSMPRRAGLSSFGAGGSNFHMILEEYTNQDTVIETNDPTVNFFVLSAKTASQLDQYAGNIRDFIENVNQKLFLRDIVYTLQVGRVPMEERLVIITDSMETLKNELDGFLNNKPSERIFRGSVLSKKNRFENLLDEEDQKELIQNLARKKKFNQIAQLWLTGLDVDWDAIMPCPGRKRIPIPVIPFNGKKYWISGRHTKNSATYPLQKIQIVPDKSLGKGLTYEIKLRPTSKLIKNYAISGRHLLPQSVLLEMLLTVVLEVTANKPFTLKRFEVKNQMLINNHSIKYQVTLEANEDDILCVIHSVEKTAMVVHANCRFVKQISKKTSFMDLQEIRKRNPKMPDVQSLYSQLELNGLHWGPFYQQILSINISEKEVLLHYRIPASLFTPDTEFGEKTVILEMCLQAITLLPNHPVSPAINKIEEVTVFGDLPYEGIIHLEQISEYTYQISVTNEAGEVLVSMQGIQAESFDSYQNFFYTPQWKEVAVSGSGKQSLDSQKPNISVVIVHPIECFELEKTILKAFSKNQVKTICLGNKNEKYSATRWEVDVSDPKSFDLCLRSGPDPDVIYFLGGVQNVGFGSADIDPVDHSRDVGIITLFRLFKVLEEQGAIENLDTLNVITNDIYAGPYSQDVNPVHADLHGWVQVLSKEYPHINIQLIDVAQDDLSYQSESNRRFFLKVLTRNADGQLLNHLFIRQKRCFQRELVPVRLPTNKKEMFRQQGVYLILGGNGGLGFVFSSYLARKYKANIVWIGRSAPNNKTKEKQALIQKEGGKLTYIQADATNLREMKNAVDTAKSLFGNLNGVFHSAIVLQDKAIKNMNEITLRSVLEPKMSGSWNLYQAVSDEPLDFLLFFSSSVSFQAPPGQGNYVAGSTFQDNFAHYLDQHTSYPVKTINWGYWGTVGIVASEKYNRLMQQAGYRSIDPQEGIECVHRILAAPLGQVMAIKADRFLLEEMGVGFDQVNYCFSEKMPSIFDQVIPEIKAENKDRDINRFKEGYRELMTQGNMWLLNIFQAMGVFRRKDETYTMADLEQRLHMLPRFQKLLWVIINILQQHEFLRLEEDVVITGEKVEEIQFAEFNNRNEYLPAQFASSHPEMEAHVNLLWTCLQAYPEVLQGNVAPTDVMFPEGSLRLVEGIYKYNAPMDYFNRSIAAAVRTYIQHRIPGLKKDEKIKMIEIGAGTGSTSSFVFEAIKEYEKHLHYHYTDISKLFTLHGQQHFSDVSYIEFAVLDIEKTPSEQGFKLGDYDLVIATNVLHATQNLGRTFAHVKTLLKRYGLLLMNELTGRQDFMSMTYGLLEGWWLAEDTNIRLSGTPLLETDMWKSFLSNMGFCKIKAVEHHLLQGTELSQNVLVAESDGMIQRKEKIVQSKSSHDKALKKQKQIQGQIKEQNKQQSPEHSDPSNESSGDQIQHTESVVKNIIASVLQGDQQDYDVDKPFSEFGVDSVLSIKIIQKISNKLSVRLRAADLYNFPNIQKLVRHIVDTFGKPPESTTQKADLSDRNNKRLTEAEAKQVFPMNLELQEDDDLMNILSELENGEISLQEAAKKSEVLLEDQLYTT